MRAQVRQVARYGNYVMGAQVGWPVVGLRPGTRHMFRVTARNFLGYAPWSPESLILPSKRAKPSPPNLCPPSFLALVHVWDVRVAAVYPGVPSTPIITLVPDVATVLHVNTIAPRSNGADIFE